MEDDNIHDVPTKERAPLKSLPGEVFFLFARTNPHTDRLPVNVRVGQRRGIGGEKKRTLGIDVYTLTGTRGFSTN